jgi:DNA-binding LacI/PurR family transcriptional regulator
MENIAFIRTTSIGGRLAARYLLSKGVRNPCYIAVEPPAQANEDRYRGFTEELSLHGYTDCATFHAGLSEDSGYEAAHLIIAEGRHDGIFCYCDDIATGAARAIRETGAPIRIVGFDGVRTTAYLDLSTVSQEPQEIGTLAASLIVEIIRSQEDPDPVSHKIHSYPHRSEQLDQIPEILPLALDHQIDQFSYDAVARHHRIRQQSLNHILLLPVRTASTVRS